MTFVRPEWLWLFIVLIPITYLWLKHAQPKTNWQQVIEADLYQAIAGNLKQSHRKQSWLLPLMFALAIIAIAGPALKLGNVQTATQGNLVVILDNSLSMEATDVTPNRITRAKRMITDWTQNGLFSQSAVIVYSGSAHWLTPFTGDAKTLDVQLAPIDPFIMPALGSHPEYAFALLNERLNTLPESQLNILWLTDDITLKQADKIERMLPEKANKYLAIIGTEQGSAIPLPNDNGFLTDGDNMVIVKVDRSQLHNIGQKIGFNSINLGDQPTPDLLSKNINQKTLVPNSQEVGYWLVIPIIALFILLMRSQAHLLFTVAVIAFVSYPSDSYANEISDLFLNADQKAKQFLDQQEYQQALETAKSAELKGHAAFGLGDYELAADEFENLNTATGFYNYGNSLAQQGKLPEAISAYDQALTLADHTNARNNKLAIEAFLKQQEQQQSQDSSTEQQPDNKEAGDPQSSESESNQSEQGEPEQSQNSPSEAAEPTESEQQSEAEASEESNEEPEESDQQNANQGQETNESALSPEELRQQQQIESLLNQLESTPGYVTQHKFKYQFQQNPTQEEGTLW
ncbi:VWA domain-containing protein [Reinekea sp.]|jgi:Ca-activated chloride channel family protein|uniref:VWA domain-containing protein n=1 Tax=Reinekea sp. TaxID=1970455 RepID=UPI00398A2403